MDAYLSRLLKRFALENPKPISGNDLGTILKKVYEKIVYIVEGRWPDWEAEKTSDPTIPAE